MGEKSLDTKYAKEANMTTAHAQEDTMVTVDFFPGLHCHHFRGHIDDGDMCKGLTSELSSNKTCINVKCLSILKVCPACLEQDEMKRIGHRPEICCEFGKNLCEFHLSFGAAEKRKKIDVDAILKSKPIFKAPASFLKKIQEARRVDKEVELIDSSGEVVVGKIILINRSRITPFKEQPRKHFSKPRLQELAESILEMGQIVPIIVKRIIGNVQYDWELVNGERRYLACGIAGIEEMFAVEKKPKDKKEQFLLSVVANFCQEGHTPLEIATAIKQIKDDYGYTEEKIARILGKSNWWVNTYFHLLDLHPDIQKLLDPELPKKEQINISVAVYISNREKDHKKQLTLIEEIKKSGLNTNQARAHIRAKTDVGRKALRDAGHIRGRRPSDDYKILQDFLSRTITGMKMQFDLGGENIKKLFEHRPYDARQEFLDQLFQISKDAQKLRSIIDSVA